MIFSTLITKQGKTEPFKTLENYIQQETANKTKGSKEEYGMYKNRTSK